jgi:hypothetical protein
MGVAAMETAMANSSATNPNPNPMARTIHSPLPFSLGIDYTYWSE